ncbi:MAG: type II toxin-antitoxin system VapC family toxin [Flavobacteriales bacterium]
MNLLFDTNVILYYLTKNTLVEKLEKQLNPFGKPNLPIISIVTEAELKSLAIQRGWGEKKINQLDEFLSQFLKVPIQSKDLISAYSDIDSYSHHKNSNFQYPKNYSSKTMGKNDIWIAATAKVTDSLLITNDGDFDHLNSVFFKVYNLTKEIGS